MSVGTTRIAAQAGAVIDVSAYLAGDLAETKVPIMVANIGWTYGTGANQVNLIYQDKITLADDATTTLSFFDGGLLNIYNVAMTMSSLKLLYIHNNSADATLNVFGGASLDLLIVAATSDILYIKPGGTFLWADPSAAGTLMTVNKNLKLLHGGQGSSDLIADVIVMGLD